MSGYFFNYENEFGGGSFDMRRVVSWQAAPDGHLVRLDTGERVTLGPEDFSRFLREQERASTPPRKETA